MDDIKTMYQKVKEIFTTEHHIDLDTDNMLTEQLFTDYISSQLDPLVMPLLIKDEIAQKLIDRLNLYEKQYASDYGFINKQKIAHKVEELKKCIQIVQSA